MDPVARPAEETSRPAAEPAATIRNAIRRLHGLDSGCARRVEALAFILARVADADDVVSEAELAQIAAELGFDLSHEAEGRQGHG